ncbi:MAG TPA: topoisomerase C-terminal repeat-containing protein, partial [Macromonas sp.]|nr:topoisomerase C-terminal repeat-containing protein [Macromonas sp.]
AAQPTPSCDFKSGTVILQQAIAPEQMHKLLSTGKTDLLENFISNKTRRAFKAFLAWDPGAGKVNFEFEPRASKYPPRKTAAASTKTPAKKAAARKTPARKKAA